MWKLGRFVGVLVLVAMLAFPAAAIAQDGSGARGGDLEFTVGPIIW